MGYAGPGISNWLGGGTVVDATVTGGPAVAGGRSIAWVAWGLGGLGGLSAPYFLAAVNLPGCVSSDVFQGLDPHAIPQLAGACPGWRRMPQGGRNPAFGVSAEFREPAPYFLVSMSIWPVVCRLMSSRA